ncbi:PhzF family phenazine biosynthesis protein [Paenibacillus cymbidii]
MKLFIVDAFASSPFRGNPAAVCILQSPLTDARMQQIAGEMNLSETAFLLNKEQHYELRWFTPLAEVDLCGHATLASAHILWEEGLAGGDATLSFSTRSGILSASRKGDRISLHFPLEPDSPCEPPQALVDGLRTPFRYAGRNRFDYIVECATEAQVVNAAPDFSLLRTLDARGVIMTSRADDPRVDFVSRCFFPALGVNEDPVTRRERGPGDRFRALLSRSVLAAAARQKRIDRHSAFGKGRGASPARAGKRNRDFRASRHHPPRGIDRLNRRLPYSAEHNDSSSARLSYFNKSASKTIRGAAFWCKNRCSARADLSLNV